MDDIAILIQALATPGGYATVKLDLPLHPKQKSVLDTLFSNTKSRVSFLCSNNVGKTSRCSVAAILYALEMKNAIVVYCTASYNQCVLQLMPKLKAYSHLYGKGWMFLENKIVIDGVNRFAALSVAEENKLQGFHATPEQPLLIITDESQGIREDIFHAIQRCNPTWLLVLGSPNEPLGYFYDVQTKPEFYNQYIHFTLNQAECTEALGYWIKQKDIDDFVAQWGKDHTLTRSSVFGEYTKDTNNNTLISIVSYDKCVHNPPKFDAGVKRVGIDFASGRAETVVAFCCGNRVTLEHISRGDPMDTVDEIVRVLERLQKSNGLREKDVYADADGLGSTMISRMRQLGWDINAFHGASKPNDPENIFNKITECWITGCQKIERCEIILPDDNRLKAQVTGRKQKRHSSGRLWMESKEEMANRGVLSPDRADAVFMAVCPPTIGMITAAKGFRRELGVNVFGD